MCMCVVHCTKSGPETGHKSCIIMFCFPGHLIYISSSSHDIHTHHSFLSTQTYIFIHDKQTNNKQ